MIFEEDKAFQHQRSETVGFIAMLEETIRRLRRDLATTGTAYAAPNYNGTEYLRLRTAAEVLALQNYLGCKK